MSRTSDLLESARQLQQGGQLPQAQSQCEEILRQEPKNAAAMHLLGIIYWQLGQPTRSVDFLRRAIESDRRQPAYFVDLGEAFRGLCQWADAIECYTHAIRMVPAEFSLHNNLGTLLQRSDRLGDAIASYQRALQLDPENVEGNFNLGTALQKQGKFHPASLCYEKVLAIKPDHVRALMNLGGIRKMEGDLAAAEGFYRRALDLQNDSSPNHYNLANVLQLQGHSDKAIESYRRALELDGNNAEVLCNLGSVLQEQRQTQESLLLLQKAVQLRPDFSAAQSNLGVTLQDLGRLPEAQRCFERAIELEPGKLEYAYNLATALKDQGDLAGAIARFEQVLRVRPNHAQARCGSGTAWLAGGDFERGWAAYEHRVGCPYFDTFSFSKPRWDGSAWGDSTLLIHCEQGLGDTLQFIRYVKLAEKRGSNLLIAAQPALIPLLSQSGFGSLVSRDEPLPPFDLHAPLMSLPHVFGTRIETIPSDIPYLIADQQRIETWRDELAAYQGLKVGIVWQGRPTHRGDCLRSMPLSCFAPIAQVPGVRLFSLQKGAGSEQLAPLANSLNVVDLGSRLDNSGGAFMDTAAVLRNLDLVITPDTAMAHLAGALGVRVWVALSGAADWRWMRDREDTPWYPTIRLFRQTTLGQWSDVFERIASQLRNLSMVT